MTSKPPTRSPLRPDLLSGLVASAVVLPKAMAYATVAGLPVEVGLYTALVPMVVYALLGTSRVLSVSSTATLAILTATQLAVVVPDGNASRLLVATATLTAMVGAILLLARIARLGFAANFISTPVLVGFKAGVGLVIVLDQIPKLLGVHVEKHSFLHDSAAIAASLPQTSLPTLAVAVATFAVLIGLERLRPHSPAPLIAVGGAIAAAWLFGLGQHGVDLVGAIPRGLPSIALPDPDLVVTLLPGALGIALMSFTESIAAGRAFATREEPPIQPNRELVAIGAANLGGAFFGAMPAGGGTSQTAVVRATGGQTQRVSLVTAAVALATMLLLAPVLGFLPQATLAAIVVVYSIGLIQPAEFLAILRVRRREFSWAIIAFVGVALFGTLNGILVAIVLSLLSLASDTAHPHVHVIVRKRGLDFLRPISPEHPDDEAWPGLLIVRPEGRIYFANVQNVTESIAAWVAAYRPRVLALDLSRVPDLEYSALQMLIDASKHPQNDGIERWLVGLSPGVLEVVRRSGLADLLGHERLLFNARVAIERYASRYGDGTVSSAEFSQAAGREHLRRSA